MSEQFAIVYDYRSDNGPDLVGPFPSKSAANDYADSLLGPGWSASYSVWPLTEPAGGERR